MRRGFPYEANRVLWLKTINFTIALSWPGSFMGAVRGAVKSSRFLWNCRILESGKQSFFPSKDFNEHCDDKLFQGLIFSILIGILKSVLIWEAMAWKNVISIFVCSSIGHYSTLYLPLLDKIEIWNVSNSKIAVRWFHKMKQYTFLKYVTRLRVFTGITIWLTIS